MYYEWDDTLLFFGNDYFSKWPWKELDDPLNRLNMLFVSLPGGISHSASLCLSSSRSLFAHTGTQWHTQGLVETCGGRDL